MTRRTWLAACVALVVPLALAPARLADSPAPGPIRFEERPIEFTLQDGAQGAFHLVELMPGGVAAIDYDHDGCMDLFFANGAELPSLRKTGPRYWNRLFHNDCHGHFTDVTERAGLAGEGYSMGVAVGDYDGDGWPDLFVTGVGGNHLYRNRHDGTFEDRTGAAGLAGAGRKPWSIAAGFFDFDNNGWPDLFVANYVDWDPSREPACGAPAQRFYCHPANYKGSTNQLYRNNRDGTFTDISAESGVGALVGRAMGVAFADFDGDGRTDIYVSNDSMRGFLFMNQGAGRFRELGLEMGAAFGDAGRPVAGMGVDARDYDNDGRADIVVTAMVNDSFLLFHNLGKPQFFEDATARSGLAGATRTLTGWGVGMVDFDNDGWKDLFFATAHFPQFGRVFGGTAELANRVFRNLGNGRFEDVSAGAGLGEAALNRGAAFADFDGDGRIDAVVSRVGAPARFYHNITAHAGHALVLREPLGTHVEVTLPDGRKLYDFASASRGYGSSSDPAVRFGLGGFERPAQVRVRRPGQNWALR
jgi:hypothetical protein